MRTNLPGHPSPKTPPSLATFATVYENNSWRQHTLEELGQAVAFFCKRSQQRSDARKRAKDLRDANNYLAMLTAHVDAFITDATGKEPNRTERTEETRDLLDSAMEEEAAGLL